MTEGRSCGTKHRKIAFESQRAAQLAILLFWKNNPSRERHPVRAYLCPCGAWHMTSWPNAERPPDLAV